MNTDLLYEFHRRRCGDDCTHTIIEIVKGIDRDYLDFRKFIFEVNAPKIGCPKCNELVSTTNKLCPNCGAKIFEKEVN